ncbi:MAG: NAD(P)-dependent oxidoreductase [Phenylobacterium sp.]|uniref:SDR family oxidoreductase n=1 Tax=Phenylobacterium sp. TaxID=1871053 RepID=UPI002730473D|nr:NAD(P)-dependent oxidoreductase [Phenylobacterium sp.]MDP2010309.1 NAD(P)-dependent oxidoreductase [Phenylobacterium sp.]
MRRLQLWGGLECTVNRVGDQFHDQVRRSGHHDRIGDLDLVADLGVRTLRYPVLWEKVAPDRADECDWRWTDARLDRLKALDIAPIAGLVHHGSGPRRTHLLDPNFAAGLADFARAAAERYPHVRDWTPVNEPLTTARFSALYGHWHPHAADEKTFWVALLNQIDGVRLSMAAIRQVTPDARLIQTEDLGRTYATPGAAYQATYDNDRRWMTWDLLEGRVTRDHPLWRRLARMDLGDRLAAIAQAPCPSDVIGVNHYVTSDRHLDHRLERYPFHTRGGNGLRGYADVEAVRVIQPGPGLVEGAMGEAWDRYGRTLALTECHLGCTREEQIRWLREAWDSAQALRDRGADVEAVTAWALFGSYDWDNLLTRADGGYETGAFDLRGPVPRPTALAATIRSLARGEQDPSPAAAGPGWWRRDVRLIYSPVFTSVQHPQPRPAWHAPQGGGRPLLITGASGTLGAAMARSCEWRGLGYMLTDRASLSLDDPAQMAAALDRLQPWAVINTAGWVRVDEAEQASEACFAANTSGAARLAEACAARGLPFVGFSSDLVFDGKADRPYVESDAAGPLNVYGASKLAAERHVISANDRALMIRTAAFFSPYDPHNFASQLVHRLAAGQSVIAAGDLIVSPTYVPDLVDAVLDLLIDGETGLWHLTNEGAVSWAEFGGLVAGAFGFNAREVGAAPWRTLGWTAERPAYAALASGRGRLMPTLESAIARYRQSLSHEGGLRNAGATHAA